MLVPGFVERDVTPERYAAGDTIFEAGEKGDLMYLVREGQVDIKVGDRVVETVEPDGIFGEMALIDEGPRSAAAVAKTDCVLLPINEKRFLFMVDETPFFAIQVMRIMSRRLRSAGSQIK